MSIDVENDFVPVSLIFSFARVGDTLVFGSSANVGGADAALLEEYMRTMVGRA